MGETFRTARAMAEIALREGKIAHVIHQFSTANRLAGTPALRRWSANEAEYFSNLHTNDDYMELEISRIDLLETVEKYRSTALRIAFFGFPAIVIGMGSEDIFLSNLGWAISMLSIAIWMGLILGARLLSRRIPYEMAEQNEI